MSILTNEERQYLGKIIQLREEYEKTGNRKLLAQISQYRRALQELYPRLINQYSNCPNPFTDASLTQELRNLPSDAIYAYYDHRLIENQLLYEYGYFNIKELAVVIKLLYSFEQQREYKLSTWAGINRKWSDPHCFTPIMFFAIGNNESLKKCSKYNGQIFHEGSSLRSELYNYFNNIHDPRDDYISPSGKRNLVILNQIGREKPLDNNEENKLGISGDMLYSQDSKKVPEPPKGIYYYRGYDRSKEGGPNWTRPVRAVFSDECNIFDNSCSSVLADLKCSINKNIGATLSFPLAASDIFIAQALLKIVMWKSKMGKFTLDNEDYRFIFHELYGEDVDVAKLVETEIPQELKSKGKRRLTSEYY